MAYGWYNFAIGVATLPSSLVFGALYQLYGAFVAFCWGAGLALASVAMLLAVSEGRTSLTRGRLEPAP